MSNWKIARASLSFFCLTKRTSEGPGTSNQTRSFFWEIKNERRTYNIGFIYYWYGSDKARQQTTILVAEKDYRFAGKADPGKTV